MANQQEGASTLYKTHHFEAIKLKKTQSGPQYFQLARIAVKGTTPCAESQGTKASSNSPPGKRTCHAIHKLDALKHVQIMWNLLNMLKWLKKWRPCQARAMQKCSSFLTWQPCPAKTKTRTSPGWALGNTFMQTWTRSKKIERHSNLIQSPNLRRCSCICKVSWIITPPTIPQLQLSWHTATRSQASRNCKRQITRLVQTETYRNVPLRCFPQCSRANSIPLSAPSTWHDMIKIEIVCSPSSASHQPSTELRQDVGPAWQLLLCFCQGAIGVLVKQHPGLLSPQAFGEGLIWGHRVRTYQASWLNSRSTTCLPLLCIPHVICIYIYM